MVSLSSLPSSLKATALVGLSGLFAGCAAVQDSPIPGQNQDAAKFEPIEEATILSALKCQIVNGFLEVEKLKKTDEFKDHPSVDKFNYQPGSGTFSGSFQTLRTNSGDVKLIVPFSGFDGTIASPGISRSSSSTAVQTIKRSFNFKTDVDSADAQICSDLAEDHVTPGTFIQDAIVSGFKQTMNITLNSDNEAYGPTFSTSAIETTASFTVVRKDQVGIEVKSVPSAPRLNEGLPSLSTNADRTDIYTITLKLPTIASDDAAERRILSGVIDENGRVLLVDENYSDTLHGKYKSELQGAADFTGRMITVPRALNYNPLSIPDRSLGLGDILKDGSGVSPGLVPSIPFASSQTQAADLIVDQPKGPET